MTGLVELTRRANSPAGFMRKRLIRSSSSCSGPVGVGASGASGARGLRGRVAWSEGGGFAPGGVGRPAGCKGHEGDHEAPPGSKESRPQCPRAWVRGRWPANKVLVFRGGARPSSPDSGSSPPSTNDIHIRSRNTQRSREYFPRPLLGSGPIPLGRGYKVCAPARARPSARKGACRGADEPALRDLEEGPGVLSEVERTGDKERSCSFFTLLGNCPCAR